MVEVVFFDETSGCSSVKKGWNFVSTPLKRTC